MIKPFEKPIYVTRPFLPPLEEFCKGLEEIWQNAWLTNNGPVLQRYRRELCSYFETENVCLFNNGTLALQIALAGHGHLGRGHHHAVYVCGHHARAVLEQDPPRVRRHRAGPLHAGPGKSRGGHHALDDGHSGGARLWLSLQIDALADIARRHKVKLIYDAAHAFGVTIGGRSLAHCGDLSMYSFHATKLYHSIEGGVLVFQDPGLKGTFDYLKNFGFKNEVEVVMPGTNAKMNEMQALMGLLMLGHLDELIAKRAQITERYRRR